jgi:hypothetical protein
MEHAAEFGIDPSKVIICGVPVARILLYAPQCHAGTTSDLIRSPS